MRRTAIVLAAAVALSACGGDDAPDPPPQATPQWSVVGNTISCPNASDTNSFRSGSYQSFDCVWYCVTYKGNPSRYVDLTFEWTGSTWVLRYEYVSGGICG
jgi:hypothetical protein